MPLEEAESSFGLLYATSLRRTLAADLLAQLAGPASTACAAMMNPSSPSWRGAAFVEAYAGWGERPPLFNCTVSTTGEGGEGAPQPPAPRKDESERLALVDAALWEGKNVDGWAWTFVASSSSSTSRGSAAGPRGARGTVDRAHWLENRFGACNASYSRFGLGDGGRMAVRPISLCEPAPVASLQAFCKAMLQYRSDIANVNCEVMGEGACLYRPAAFYVPYAWSGTNQEFAAETVTCYYESILQQQRFGNESYGTLCPARSSYTGSPPGA